MIFSSNFQIINIKKSYEDVKDIRILLQIFKEDTFQNENHCMEYALKNRINDLVCKKNS